AAVPALSALAACGGAGGGSGTTEVTYGYIPDFNGASLLAIADEQGLWEENGLKADLQTFTNGPLQIQALGTGDLDFGYIGPGAMWLPASGKAKVLTVNGVGQADRVIAQPGISSIEDLAGKKVGIPEGTSGDMIVQLALEAAGMSLDDIEKVAMDPATVVSAFSSAQVEAAGIWYPMIDNIKQQVPDLVELAQNSDFADVMQFPNVMVTGAEYPEKNEETTLAVLKVLRSAMDHRVDDLDGTIELVAKMTDSDAEAVAGDAANGEYYKAADLDALVEDGTIETWLTAMNEYFEKNGKIEGETVAPADFYTFDLFTKAGERPSRPLRTTLPGSVPPGRATSCRSSPTSTAPTPWAATATPWCAPRTWMPSPAAAPASTAGTRRARSARPPGPACSPATRPSATSCWRTTNATSATRRICPTGSSPSPSRCGMPATTADCWANGTPGPRSCEATTASTVPSCRA